MKMLASAIGLLTSIIAIVVNYHAWVDGDYICQIILWMLVPLVMFGLCLPQTPANMAVKVKDVRFWIFSAITIPIQCWIWFGGHSNVGFFYGIMSLTVTTVALMLAATYIIKQ